MTVGIDQAPTGCNPNTTSGDTWADRLLLEPVLPSAFDVDDSDQAVYDPALITQAELQSTSPETVVYTINPHAVWSDGTPVTAADFVFTWQAEIAAAGTGGTGATGRAANRVVTTSPGATGTTGPLAGYRRIASVTPGTHGRTVTVVFETPYANWQSLFDYLLPAHVLEQTGWNPACKTLDPSIDLSAGPYVLGTVVPGREVVLVRNPRWWEQEPPLDKIVVRIASGPAQLSLWLADGEVDVALPTGYGEHFLEAVTSQPSVTTQSQLSTTFLQLEFSTTSPLTSSTDVRLAVAHAIDRQSIVDEVVGWASSTIVPAASHLYAQTQPGYPGHKPPPLQVSGQPGYVSATSPGTSSTATPFPSGADLATTARLLDDVGAFRSGTGPWRLATGGPLDLRMAVDVADPWAARTAADLVDQLDTAGLAVSLVRAPSAEDAGMDLADGRADLALLPMRSSPYPSQAIAWYSPLLGAPGTGGSQDWSGFDDTNVDTLLERASEELNPVDAAPLYAEVDTALWQQMVALPLFTQPSVLASSGLTSGVSPNPNGPSLLWETQDWALRVPSTSAEAKSS